MTDIKALRDLLAQTPNGWRMSGYYYGFGSTGLAGIDRILSAVGCAGKGYHHTERWADGPGDGTGYDHLRGDTYIEAIQNAADDAAAALRSLPALLDRLEAQERRVADLRSATQDLVLNVTEAMHALSQPRGHEPARLLRGEGDARAPADRYRAGSSVRRAGRCGARSRTRPDRPPVRERIRSRRRNAARADGDAMRPWAQWCIDHNLRWLLYVVAVTLLPVVGVIYLWGKAFPEVLDDTLHSLRAIGKQRKTGAKA